jgi:hypothetical protein
VEALRKQAEALRRERDEVRLLARWMHLFLLLYFVSFPF